MLTILITFYNQDSFIERTLNSCLDAFYSSLYSFKIIVCLQNSTNVAFNALSKISKKNNNISFFTTEYEDNIIPLSKASLNRYELLRKATSKYCLFLDGDDMYISNVDDGIAFLEKNDKIAGCGYSHLLFDWNTNKIKSFATQYKNGETISFKNHVKYIHANCIVFRRELLLNKIDPMYCNDTTITRTLLYSGMNIKFFSRNLMLYSVGISSIYSGSSHLEQKLTEFIVNEENLAFFPEYSGTFLEKLKHLTKGKGTIRPAQCWRSQIISRRLFLSNLYLKSISSKSPIVRLLFKTSLKLCIYAKKSLLLIRNAQHSDVILPRQK